MVRPPMLTTGVERLRLCPPVADATVQRDARRPSTHVSGVENGARQQSAGRIGHAVRGSACGLPSQCVDHAALGHREFAGFAAALAAYLGIVEKTGRRRPPAHRRR